MEAQVSSPPRLARRRLLPIAAALAVVAGVAVGVIALTGGGGGGPGTVKGPAGSEFTMLKPDGWTALSQEQRRGLPGNPLAVLRRDDHKGLVVVNAQAGTAKNLDTQVRRLDQRLKKAIPDFRKVGSRVVRVKAGTALLYSYARGRRGTAHSLLVVPAGARSYTVNAAVPAGANQAARQVGQILRSFDR